MTIANTARALNLRARRRDACARRLPPLLLMTDARRLPDPLAVLDRLPRGAGIVLRHYPGEVGLAARAQLARRLASAARVRGLKLIVAGDARLAARVGADGVHLPEWMVGAGGVAARRARLRPGWIVTAACHSEAALIRAARLGADAALLAPVFATASHPEARALGAVRFARLACLSPIPVYALGGVDGRGARRIRGTAAAGIAGIGFAQEY